MKRLFFQLALLLVLVHQAMASPALNRFEEAIHVYESRDAQNPPPQGGTVFVGSSTFALWGDELEHEFRDFAAINRGFGGSTIAEISYYHHRIIERYHPRRIVFYAGTNDIADGRTPEQVLHDFKIFVRLVRGELRGVKIAFISLSLPPSRVQWKASYLRANRLLRSYCARAKVTFVDVSRCLLDAQGNPRAEFFREDALHMRPTGYAIWVPIIRGALSHM